MEISWKSFTFLACALFALPLLVIVSSVFTPNISTWQHLFDTVLGDYISNSLILMVGVGLGSIFIGTGLAWAVSQYQFTGRSWVQGLALLPLAMPAYIIAYTYTGILDYAGPVQSYLRVSHGSESVNAWFPEIRSLGGAIIMMSLVLYPYVYILARTAFTEQSSHLKEVSQLAGKSSFTHFLHVSLPLARPAILTGAALAMMEALSDFGTVEYFGISTFTTGIYRTWFGMGELATASQLSALLCVFVLVLLILEKRSRHNARSYVNQQKQSARRQPCSKAKSTLILLLCLLPIVIGFIIPFAQLTVWATQYSANQAISEYLQLAYNSAGLALLGASLIVLCALLLSYAKRILQRPWVSHAIQALSLGYAMPGIVVAIGVLAPMGFADKIINQISMATHGELVGLIFSGSLFTLIFAYAVRFMGVALNNTEVGLARVSMHMDEVARSLGSSRTRTLRKIHFPLLSASLLSAFLLVFVDILKELPATLILRPFNFNTLAVKSFELASDERLNAAALPAVSIVLVGLVPVALLTKILDRVNKRDA